MIIVSQTPRNPSAILLALKQAAAPGTDRLKIAVAYTTEGGVRLLLSTLKDALGAGRFAEIPKALVTSFDFMHTEPKALSLLMDEGFNVRIAAHGATSYHPKIYLFEVGEAANLIVGSANLSRRAFTVNSEAVVVAMAVPLDKAVCHFDVLVADSQALDDDLLQKYSDQRALEPRPKTKVKAVTSALSVVLAEAEVDPPVPSLTGTTAGQSLAEAMADGLEVASRESFWVDGGTLSGGSRNQLELSRSALAFFGVDATPEALHSVYTELILRANGREWSDRKLTWHGAPDENQMVRLNLPTETQGGYDYTSVPILLFRRDGGGYQLLAAERDSDLAISWRNASIQERQLFKLGRASRECGFF